MATINVDDVYVLDETGAQVDKVTGLAWKDEGLTEEQAAQARANIRAGGSNRNLLDNGWFADGAVVNQRGVTSGDYATRVYRMDRWYTSYGANPTGRWELSNQGLTMDLVGYSNSRGWFVQNLDNPSRLVGKTVTGSIMMSDGTIYSGTGVVSSSPTTLTYFCIYPDFQIYYSTQYGFNIVCNKDYTITVKAVKLELGPYSTLANDVPPDYGTELFKCQRYFTRWYSTSGSSAIGVALAIGTTSANFALLSNLRAEGSTTISFTGLTLSDGTVANAVTNVAVAGAGDGKSMRLLVTSSNLVAYRPYILQMAAGGYLDVSKDL